MKKLISLILACALAFACLAALGGCGKEIDSKRAFIDSESYYAALADNLAAPVADIDSQAIADAQAGGYEGSVSFSVEGLEALQNALESVFAQFFPDGAPALLTDGSFDIDFITDGLALSGSFDAVMLGETLRMIFFTDGEGNGGYMLPDLLGRPVRIDSAAQGDFSEFFDPQAAEDAETAETEEVSCGFLDGTPADEAEPLIDEALMLRLLAKYADRFLENLPDDCYSNGKDEFVTADGVEELDCVCLSADGKTLLGAFVKTLRELAQDADLGELFGDETAQVREKLNAAADEAETDETVLVQAAKSALAWTRFMKNEKTVGEKLYAALPEAEYTVTAGIDEGDEDYAYLTVVDEKGGFTLFSAESRVGKKKATLDISFDADGTTYSFSVSGKTKEQEGVKTTEANIKIGYGEFSFNVFKIVTGVRAFDAERIDLDCEISSDIISMLTKGKTLKLDFAIDAKRVADAAVETFDLSGAYTDEEIADMTFANELAASMREKLPNIYALLTGLSGESDPAL